MPFALGGATSGHAWREDQLVERNRRLDVNALKRHGALVPGMKTMWAWADGRRGTILAAHGKIFLISDHVQEIRFGTIPLTLVHGGARARLFCACGRGAYYLYDDRHGEFACRQCCTYDWKCRHRRRYRRPLIKEKVDG